MQSENIIKIAINALEDLKGNDITIIDTSDKTDVFDAMIIVTGTSDRHVQSLADRLLLDAKKNNIDIFGVERDRSWVLVDLYDVIVHVMLEETRKFYSLEKLWQITNISINSEASAK